MVDGLATSGVDVVDVVVQMLPKAFVEIPVPMPFSH
jgi:hypothetical protein